MKAGTTKSGITTLDAPSLQEGSEYLFRVSAENEEGFGPAAELTEAVVPVKEPGKNCICFVVRLLSS